MKVYNDGFVYCLYDKHNSICRIGMTEAGESRITGQLAYYPFEMTVTKDYCKNRRHAEKWLHKFFKEKKQRADWFKITPDDFTTALALYKKTLESKAGVTEFRVVVLYDDEFKNSMAVSKKLNHLFQNIIEKIIVVYPTYKKYDKKRVIETYCHQRGIYCKKFEPDWANIKNPKSVIKSNYSTVYNATAIYEMHDDIIKYADALVFFTDGSFRGNHYKLTQIAKEQGMKVREVNIEKKIKALRAA